MREVIASSILVFGLGVAFGGLWILSPGAFFIAAGAAMALLALRIADGDKVEKRNKP